MRSRWKSGGACLQATRNSPCSSNKPAIEQDGVGGTAGQRPGPVAFMPTSQAGTTKASRLSEVACLPGRFQPGWLELALEVCWFLRADDDGHSGRVALATGVADLVGELVSAYKLFGFHSLILSSRCNRMVHGRAGRNCSVVIPQTRKAARCRTGTRTAPLCDGDLCQTGRVGLAVALEGATSQGAVGAQWLVFEGQMVGLGLDG